MVVGKSSARADDPDYREQSMLIDDPIHGSGGWECIMLCAHDVDA